MFNSLGSILQLTTFGESHGRCIGGILDGLPAGLKIDYDHIQKQLDRRRPGQSTISTDRREVDKVEFLSGILDNISTGHPIAFQISNKDKRSGDYSNLKNIYRPSHADYTYEKKYDLRDIHGGGRSSARETANWVVAGALVKQIIPDIEISSFVSSVGNVSYDNEMDKADLSEIDSNIVRCPDADIAEKMIAEIENVKHEGDSLGGTITCVVKNMLVGLGEPIFHKLEAELAKAMLSINACKGFEIGSGFLGTRMKGSEHNDEWLPNAKTKTNNSGGVQGGISNGMELVFKLAFKPTSTISISQRTVDMDFNQVELEAKGRHDSCVLPRAVPIVDMLTSFVLADMFLLSKLRKI